MLERDNSFNVIVKGQINLGQTDQRFHGKYLTHNIAEVKTLLTLLNVFQHRHTRLR